jgi:hypothetical protein
MNLEELTVIFCWIQRVYDRMFWMTKVHSCHSGHLNSRRSCQVDPWFMLQWNKVKSICAKNTVFNYMPFVRYLKWQLWSENIGRNLNHVVFLAITSVSVQVQQ